MSKLAAVLLIALAVPATAEARTIQQDLDVATAYWQTDICRSEWNVTTPVPAELAAMRQRGALASTAMTDCTIYLDPEVVGCEREFALLHEVGHFVHGREHVGPMTARALGRVPCVGERHKRQRVKARWLRSTTRIRQWWAAAGGIR